MIKITKPGQKEFHGFCKWCGCEFTYEISDLKLSATSDKLDCPTCGKTYHHPSMVQDPTIPGGIARLQTWPPESIPCTPDMTKTDPCAGCAWRENLLRDGLYVGDTPCTWCNQNKFNTITGVQPSIEDYITPCINELDTHLTTSTSSELNGTKYTTAHNSVYNSQDDVANGEVMKVIMGCCESNTNSMATSNAVYSPKNGPVDPPAPPTSGSNAVKSCNSCSGEHKCNSKKNCNGRH